MITAYDIREDRLITCDPSLARVFLFVAPDEGEQALLIRRYGLDEHTLCSTLDPNEQPRIEVETTHRAIIFKVPGSVVYDDALRFTVSSVGLFLFERELIIVSPAEIGSFAGRAFLRVGSPEEIMLKLINASIVQFRTNLQTIDRLSEELSEKIWRAMENRYLIRLFDLEKSLVYYLNAISSNSALLEKMRHMDDRLLPRPEEREFLEDIVIENLQCFKQAKIYSHILSSMTAARASIVGNNLNILMRRLTLVTIGLMIPTLVVSVFSMNVSIPLQQNEQAFWMILGLSALAMTAVLGLWRYLRRKESL